ncbi:uncharacterized mitochondrial protein AtMg00810-like [Lotus japonicus]|uniref:uncharacterized mitochondrial protein AtMg00810-like n=1 Tax=Lotus japonicus TaxID=34305 RepID=UPI0025905C72|nr:uncharacterized mitochondrial protein AtMg00810-like [Lotus japonicus]
MGEAKFFLGLEIARSTARIVLNQRKYALELLSDSGLLGCKPATTPMDSSQKLSATIGKPLSDISSYCRLIGRLLYLTTTRPDISFVVHQLSQYLSAPTDVHEAAAHRILRYIKDNPGCGLLYSASSSSVLTAFSDSDWADCADTRRSITGYFPTLVATTCNLAWRAWSSYMWCVGLATATPSCVSQSCYEQDYQKDDEDDSETTEH